MAYRPSVDDLEEGQYKASIQDLPDSDRWMSYVEGGPSSEILKQIRERKETSEMNEQFRNLRKIGGYGIMLGAPEIPWLKTALSAKKYASLPELKGFAKSLAEIASNAGKVGASAGLGTAVLPDTNMSDVGLASLIGTGVGVPSSAAAIALRSMNPFSRITGGATLGALGGYGASQLFGGQHTGAGLSLGGLAGGLLGARSPSLEQIAAQAVSEGLTPEQKATAKVRQAAGNLADVPLDLAEASGSPIIQRMKAEATASPAGSQVFYPWAQNRQARELASYRKLLEMVSPAGARESLESPLYEKAKVNNPAVSTAPILSYIDNQLTKIPENHPHAAALRKAKTLFAPSEETLQAHAVQLAPINATENKLMQSAKNIQSTLGSSQAQEQNPLFFPSEQQRAQKQDLVGALSLHQQQLQRLADQKSRLMQQSGIGPGFGNVRDLIRTKKAIDVIAEGQGDNAVGREAAADLNHINRMINKQIDLVSPEYQAGRRVSALRQTRQEIEDAMAKSKLSGSNFFDKVLLNESEYEKLQNKLRDPNIPKGQMTPAQKRLKYMKIAFPGLSDNLVEQSGKAMASTAPELHIEHTGLLKSFLNKVYLDRYNKAVAELLINPRWEKELEDISKISSTKDRGATLGRLISGVSTGLLMNAEP